MQEETQVKEVQPILDLSIKMFESLKPLEYVEDIANYKMENGQVALAIPDIQSKTKTGIIKDDYVVEEERINLVKKPLVVVGVAEYNEREPKLEIGQKVYIADSSQPTSIKILKNVLEENIRVFWFYSRNVIMISK